MSLKGVYKIHPKDAANNEFVLIGPIPLIYPPPDVPLRVGSKLVDLWRLDPVDNNTYNVFIIGGQGYKYRWATNKDKAIVTVRDDPPAIGFRFEPAGVENGRQLYAIGIFGQDSLLTYDTDAYPQLTFTPANGSSAQRFELVLPF